MSLLRTLCGVSRTPTAYDPHRTWSERVSRASLVGTVVELESGADRLRGVIPWDSGTRVPHFLVHSGLLSSTTTSGSRRTVPTGLSERYRRLDGSYWKMPRFTYHSGVVNHGNHQGTTSYLLGLGDVSRPTGPDRDQVWCEGVGSVSHVWTNRVGPWWARYDEEGTDHV